MSSFYSLTFPRFGMTGETSPLCSFSFKDEQRCEQGVSVCTCYICMCVMSSKRRTKRVLHTFPASGLLEVSSSCLLLTGSVYELPDVCFCTGVNGICCKFNLFTSSTILINTSPPRQPFTKLSEYFHFLC